jgi:hypothetical protein
MHPIYNSGREPISGISSGELFEEVEESFLRALAALT